MTPLRWVSLGADHSNHVKIKTPLRRHKIEVGGDCTARTFCPRSSRVPEGGLVRLEVGVSRTLGDAGG